MRMPGSFWTLDGGWQWPALPPRVWCFNQGRRSRRKAQEWPARPPLAYSGGYQWLVEATSRVASPLLLHPQQRAFLAWRRQFHQRHRHCPIQ